MKLTEDKLVSGFKYTVKCGWGDTKAEYLYSIDYNGKRQHNWQEVGGIRFVSYDLEDTVEL